MFDEISLKKIDAKYFNIILLDKYRRAVSQNYQTRRICRLRIWRYQYRCKSLNRLTILSS